MLASPSRPSRLRRPRPAVTAVALAALLVTGACTPGDSPAPQSAPTGTTAAGTFPTQVTHRYGNTEISQAPQRIITLGFSDQDFVLAFGTAPVAVTDWYGDYEFATWPWAQDELGTARPEVLNKGEFTGSQNFDYERIAALDPDLIIGLYTGMTQQEYDTLSRIAPTVASSADYPEYGMPWQASTRLVGQALGQPQRAEELITDVEARFTKAAGEHPEFAGKQAVVAEMFEPGSSFVRSATDPRTVFLTSLGFSYPADLGSLSGSQDGAKISDEQMALLDRDLLIWNVGHDSSLRAQIEAKPLYPQLGAVTGGRVLFVEDPLVSGALTWGTVLSLPYALDRLVPQLADTLKD